MISLDSSNIILTEAFSSEIETLDFENDEIADEIESFSKLPAGWDFGNGNQINERTILKAKRAYLICNLHGFGVEPHPNSDGTITLISFIEDHFLDIDIIETEDLKLRYEIGKGINYKVEWKDKKVSLSNLEFVLLEIKSKCKNAISSETLISEAITAQKRRDLEMTEFSSLMAEEFRFFVKSAQMPLQVLVTI